MVGDSLGTRACTSTTCTGELATETRKLEKKKKGKRTGIVSKVSTTDTDTLAPAPPADNVKDQNDWLSRFAPLDPTVGDRRIDQLMTLPTFA